MGKIKERTSEAWSDIIFLCFVQSKGEFISWYTEKVLKKKTKTLLQFPPLWFLWSGDSYRFFKNGDGDFWLCFLGSTCRLHRPNFSAAQSCPEN